MMTQNVLRLGILDRDLFAKLAQVLLERFVAAFFDDTFFDRSLGFLKRSVVCVNALSHSHDVPRIFAFDDLAQAPLRHAKYQLVDLLVDQRTLVRPVVLAAVGCFKSMRFIFCDRLKIAAMNQAIVYILCFVLGC